MKDIIEKLSLFMVLTFLFPVVVNAAGGINVSTKSISMEPNTTKTFSISASNAAGRVDITSSDSSIATISSTSTFLDNNSVNIIVTGKRVGVATIKVTATDVATYDMEEIKTSYTITVNVVNPQTSTTKKPTTQKPSTTKTSEATKPKKTNTTKKMPAKNTTTNPSSTTTAQTSTTVDSSITVTEEAKEDPGKDRVESIKLDNFMVVGYEIKKEKGQYILNIGNDINEVYVLASSKDEDILISGNGVVNIKNKDEIKVEVSKDDIKTEYIIKIKRKNDISTVLIAALILIVVGLLTYILIIMNKKRTIVK